MLAARAQSSMFLCAYVCGIMARGVNLPVQEIAKAVAVSGAIASVLCKIADEPGSSSSTAVLKTFSLPLREERLPLRESMSGPYLAGGQGGQLPPRYRSKFLRMRIIIVADESQKCTPRESN